MSSRFVFCLRATRIFTSCPSVGPVASSVTTVNAGTPGGILGWSQQTVGAAGLVVSQAGERSVRAATAAKPRSGSRVREGIRDLLNRSFAVTKQPKYTRSHDVALGNYSGNGASGTFLAPPRWGSVSD